MLSLLNLLSAIALLIWGTHIVRTGILRVFGANLRNVLAKGTKNRFAAFASGVGVTSLVQSATATALIVSSFVGQGSISTASALAVMLGADVGSSLMVMFFSFDLRWLSPLLILCGVMVFIPRQNTTAGRLGRVAVGLGLIMLALQLIVAATRPLTETEGMRVVFASLTNDLLLDIFVGACLAMLSYSSLAIVLLTSAMATSGLITIKVALGLVLGANLGSGLLAFFSSLKSSPASRRVPLANLGFKVVGCVVALLAIDPLIAAVNQYQPTLLKNPALCVVGFHFLFNLILAIAFIGFIHPIARVCENLLPNNVEGDKKQLPTLLDRSALGTPALAIACAARESLRQADVVEQMLNGMLKVIKDNDKQLSTELKLLDDSVDKMYSAIKFYLTQISREALDERESRRWTDIISFTINMEQIGDIIERILIDIEEKKIAKGRSFSDAGMAEICDLHSRIVSNLRLGMSVFLEGNLPQAQQLIQEKAKFREMERSYAHSHLGRLSDNTTQSIETSSLHIDLISDLKRINSHVCSIAYPILEQAGVLTETRLKANSSLPLPQEQKPLESVQPLASANV
jgi:phosphate:Na+ symporter